VQLSDIVNEVLANGFDPVFFGRQRIVNFINDGYSYICAETNFTGDEATQDFQTATGTSLYPQPADLSDVRSLRDTTRRLQLQAVSLRAMDRSSDQQSSPICYALNGANFQLWPVPDGIYPIECRYWKIPAPLVADSDVPIIPAMWHWLLWTWAVGQGFRAEDDVQRANAWDARFQKGLSDFTATIVFTSDMDTRAKSMWAPQPVLGRSWSTWGG
jgi:hypothetical protein